MRLSEYFKHQYAQEMPAQLKSELFSRIQKEKNGIEISAKIPSKIFFFASKKIMYASLAAVLVFVVFGGVLLDRTQVVDFGIFSVKQNNASNGVFADYVAEIVEFNGEYSLVRDGKAILNADKLNFIQDGDIVSFPEGTDLIFNLEDGTQAKIIGPAEFSVTKTEKGYQISLFDGKFFRIYSPECKSNMEIITPDFSISQEKDQILDIHIAKEENGEMLVKNDGDKITVKTKNSEDKMEVKQISSELISINSDVDKIDVVEDDEVMVNFMAKNNISATFNLSVENVEWSDVETMYTDKLVAMQTKQISISDDEFEENFVEDDTINNQKNQKKSDDKADQLLEGIQEIVTSNVVVGDVDKEIIKDLGLQVDDKQLPTEAQMNVLTTNLNGFFLMNLFEGIYNKDEASQNISRFADRVNTISSAFGYSYRADLNISSIKTVIQSLKGQIEKERYVSPSYILQMEKVVRWCDELQNPTKLDWESLVSNLPINLRLM